MAEASKKKPTKRSSSTKSAAKKPATPKKKAPSKREKEQAAYRKLHALRMEWEQAQDVVADRNRNLNRALSIDSIPRREAAVASARSELQYAKDAEREAADAFVTAQRKAR